MSKNKLFAIAMLFAATQAVKLETKLDGFDFGSGCACRGKDKNDKGN